MDKRIAVDLFCEDAGHESFARALLRRLAKDERMPDPEIRAGSTRGGHGRAISQLKAWQRAELGPRGDLLLVLIDANSVGWKEQRREITATIEANQWPGVVVACPDPHIEAWCGADPEALREVLGVTLPPVPAGGKSVYKRWLRQALEDADVITLNDPMDICAELLPRVDLFRAGKNCPSLQHPLDELRAQLRQFAARVA